MFRYLLSSLLLSLALSASAQSPTDGLMMPKGNWCTLLQYSHTQWDEYWEGETRRSNPNLGTFSAQNAMLMTNYGITDRLNAMAALPYIWTDSDSYLEGQRGVQDLSIWLKYQVFEKKWGSGSTFKAQATGGASAPLSRYENDFLPFSIGLRSQTASLRGVLNFTHRTGLYATAQGGHTWRTNVKVHRDAYLFDDELIYSNEMPVPNVLDASTRLGYIKRRLQAELWCEYFGGLTGDDIRYNEMPQATNRMRAAAAGVFGKYYLIANRLALQASYGQVLSGRNVGKGATLAAGASYLFKL
jgi:hypothetical protein